jgi:16S rRNA (guanine527-N7)-methyltransferase
MSTDIPVLLRTCAAELDIEIDPGQLAKFCELAAELRKWNRKINLTAIRDDRDIVVKHFTDSLTLLRIVNKSGSLLDIGSGGGFPSIPLKVLLPGLSVVSVDAVEKKILFQRQAARLLQLHDFTAVHARAEELVRKYASHFDCIVSRAFSDLPHFVSLALPLLKNTGRIIAMKGREGGEEAGSAREKLAELGAKVSACIRMQLPLTGDARFLIVLEKLQARLNG